jgi:hypothetical protein
LNDGDASPAINIGKQHYQNFIIVR